MLKDFGVPVYIIFLAYALLILAQWPAATLIQNGSITLGILLNEWLIVAGLPLGLAWRWKVSLSQTFPFQKPIKRELFWTALMTLSLAIVIDYLTFLSEWLWPPDPVIKTLLDKIMTVEGLADGAWRWVLLCLTPAFCEEFFFRGFFQNTLVRHWGRRTTLFATALAFAFIHGIPQYWHLYFILGFYLSWLLLIRQNLWLPIVAHLVNNSWTYFSHVTGRKIPGGDQWVTIDSFAMGVCFLVFTLAVTQFVKRNA